MSNSPAPPMVRVRSKDGKLSGVIVGNTTGRIVRVRWDGLGDETFPAFRENLIILGEVM